MDAPSAANARRIQIITIILCLCLAAIDRMIPLEAAVGVLYVPLVVLAAFSRRPRFILVISALSTALAWLDLFISVGDGAFIWAVFDRAVATVAIWVCAGLCLRGLTAELSLARAWRIESLLRRELDHRTRRHLDFLSAMIALNGGPDVPREEFIDALRARVQRMTQVHQLLTAQRWHPVSLREILDAVLPHNAPDRVSLSGPETLIPPSQVTGLGIVLNELVLNSIRHGALGVPGGGGRLDLQWRLAADAGPGIRRLELFWHETDGPDISIYPSPGAGTELIVGFARDVLGGEVEFAYPRGGAFHRLSVRLTDDDRPTTPRTAPAEPPAAQPQRTAA